MKIQNTKKKGPYLHIVEKKTTKILKNTQLRAAFCTKNTISNILKQHTQTDKYNNSSIYQMKFLDCPLKYTGQTGRTFNLRYKEHIQAIRSNCSKSGYSNHILNAGHTYGTITDTMDVIRTGRKSRHLNTLERYHIYKICRNNLHMNETYIEAHNPILQTVHGLYNRQQYTHYLARYLSESNYTGVSTRNKQH
jgi:hypothetical protein